MALNAIHTAATLATDNSKAGPAVCGRSEDKSCVWAVSREEDKVRLRKTVLPEMYIYS
jgi:hypothetical protein